MAASLATRTSVYTFVFVYVFSSVGAYTIPEVLIQPLKPRGVRVSIPDNPHMSLFVFQGHVNRQIKQYDVGTISAEVMRPVNGRWTYQDDEVELRVGDIIYYNVIVNRNRQRYSEYGLSYFVRELVDSKVPSETPAPTHDPVTTLQGAKFPTRLPENQQPSVVSYPMPRCLPSATVTQEGRVCSGQVIFEDNFDHLQTSLWNFEHYIPAGPEHPFVSYQHRPTVSVENGSLRIEPKLQQHLYGFNFETVVSDGSVLNLTMGCTRPGSCIHTNYGPQIMPPIVSGRMRSGKFAFKYGVIEVRAKLPKGDWLYPDIILEPVNNKYGPNNYDSGILRIAGALGNVDLSADFNRDYGNKVLYGGPIMNFKCRAKLLAKKMSAVPWGEDFHTYSMRWTPDLITLTVDGVEWGRVEPDPSGLQAWLPDDACDPPRALLQGGTCIAPFDDLLCVVLGVAAGGISEFPDGMTSKDSKPKPWKNKGRKAKVDFLSDFDSWYNTWRQPEMLVDYVKVRAL